MYNEKLLSLLKSNLYGVVCDFIPVIEINCVKFGKKLIMLEVALKKDSEEFFLYLNGDDIYATTNYDKTKSEQDVYIKDIDSIKNFLLNQEVFLKANQGNFTRINKIKEFLQSELKVPVEDVKEFYVYHSRGNCLGIDFKIDKGNLQIIEALCSRGYFYLKYLMKGTTLTHESDYIEYSNVSDKPIMLCKNFLYELFDKGYLEKDKLYINESYHPANILLEEEHPLKTFNAMIAKFLEDKPYKINKITLPILLDVIPERRKFIDKKNNEYKAILDKYNTLELSDNLNMICKDNLSKLDKILKEEQLRLKNLEMKYLELSQVFLNQSIDKYSEEIKY